MSNIPLIAAQDLGVYRGDRWLIRHVDLSLDKGEIVTMIGPNGSGKSTTIKTILGIIKPDEGNVDFRSDLKVGYVPQTLSIDRSMPMTLRRLLNLTESHTDADIDQVLDEVGIKHLDQKQIHLFSGGEFRRALLARAIVRKPDVLILDEPVQGVDFAGEIALYKLINEVKNRLNCGVLLISHDLHIVMKQTDRVVCMNVHVCCSGSPQSVSSMPEYQALFGHRGAEDALALYTHHHDHDHLPDGQVVQLAKEKSEQSNA